MANPFDEALELLDGVASESEHALGYGGCRSRDYRAAGRGHRAAANPLARRSAPSEFNGDVARVLDAAIERAILIDRAAMANVQLFDSENGGLRLVADSGFSRAFVNYFELVLDTTSACGSALATRCPILVNDVTRSTIFAGTESLDVMLDAGSRAVASIPVSSSKGQLIGMISTHHTRPTTWTRARMRGLEHLAQSTGRVLDYLRCPNGEAV